MTCDRHLAVPVACHCLRNGIIGKLAFQEFPRGTQINIKNYRYFKQIPIPCLSSSCEFPQETIHNDLPTSGLHPKTLDQLSQCPTLGKSSIRFLEMKDYAYTWKS